ncbi:hypothetical protein MKW94_023192 [Papaver nudicaule]|uniref:BHLH domain-containing protein n=1 Tax=Papaver nudicaule TaxID=74823 RepID=A0AA41UXU4_PAPNU|nr:hypothetical protein [Papaver nudicaule]
MDLSEKEKFGLEKKSGDPMNYTSASANMLPSNWQFPGANQPSGLAPTSNSVEKGDLMIGSSACSSGSMMDSFTGTLWGHPTSSSHNLSLGDAGSSGAAMGNLGWNPLNSVAKQGIYLPPSTGMLHQSLSQFPADSGFIERAARYSCFNSGSFSDMLNPFNVPENLSPYSKNGGAIQGSSDVLFNGLKHRQGSQCEPNTAELAKDVSVSVNRGTTDGSPMKNEVKRGNFVRTHDETKQGVGNSSNESDDAEFSGGIGGAGQEDQSMLESAGREPSSSKGLGPRKKRRGGQVSEPDQGKSPAGEAANEDSDSKQKDDQNPSPSAKGNKHGKDKDNSQTSDAPKEDYIHVRARRGQATNSHSLAERVRREKISERMKFLQDLVPGCNKVTGKAVMLDEIINYVQSLQRQVEFLSMKLSAVNPRLDLNLESLLAKDILQSRVGPSSSMGFPQDMIMAHPQLHPSQPGLIQPGIPGMGNPSDALRRTINSQLMAMNAGYKEPNPQMPNAWDDELNNVIQMSFGPNCPFNGQDLNAVSLPPGHMKVEL